MVCTDELGGAIRERRPLYLLHVLQIPTAVGRTDRCIRRAESLNITRNHEVVAVPSSLARLLCTDVEYSNYFPGLGMYRLSKVKHQMSENNKPISDTDSANLD